MCVLCTDTFCNVYNQQQRKQVVRNQNRENKSEIAGPNSATKNVVKKGTVNGTKYCNKPNRLVMLLTKYT